MLDGVYRCGADGVPTFVEVGTPSDDELHALLHIVITRLMKLLARRGALDPSWGTRIDPTDNALPAQVDAGATGGWSGSPSPVTGSSILRPPPPLRGPFTR